MTNDVWESVADEVSIRCDSVPTILPKCNKYGGSRFRYKGPFPIAIQDHEFFQPVFSSVGTHFESSWSWAR
jgi:hypothetical protein